MYYTYVLRSLKNGRQYTGSTEDIHKRLLEHNNGESTYTKLNRPFELIYSEEYQTRQEAYKRERFFKTGKGRELLKTLLDVRP